MGLEPRPFFHRRTNEAQPEAKMAVGVGVAVAVGVGVGVGVVVNDRRMTMDERGTP